MDEDNGILAHVGGGYHAAASKKLPPAGEAEDRSYDVVIEAGHAGWVRIYFQRMRARHHKHSHWFWQAYRAEPVEPPDDAFAPR